MERNVYKRPTSDYVKIFHHFTEIKKKKITAYNKAKVWL